jgi:hypothetical protein
MIPNERVWTSQSSEFVPLKIFRADKTGLAKISLEQPSIYRHDRSSVYGIAQNPDKVIKYYSYCHDELDPIDPMVVEYFFMTRLGPLGISPIAYYLSGPASVTGPSTDKDEGKVMNAFCVDGGPGIVRYMIMERVGDSLADRMDAQIGERFSFLNSIEYGIEMIKLIKKLHHADIMHGDCHVGNFAFKDNFLSEKLMLIDFGRARFFGEQDKEWGRRDPTFCDTQSEAYVHLYAGKWEMKNCKPAFRDDVYQIVHMIAYLMHGPSHLEMMYGLPTYNFEQYSAIINSANFFDFDMQINQTPLRMVLDDIVPVSALGEIDQIRDALTEIRNIAVYENSSDPYMKPNYDGILRKLKLIKSLVR